jgi:gas vesicle protein
MNTTSKFVLGMAAAAAAGAIVGMLLAPEKGKDLQKKIASGSKDWLSEIGSLLDMGKDVINKAKSTGKSSVEDMASQLKEVSNNN